MSATSVWNTIYDRFDPYDAEIDPAWRVERERSPAPQIIKLLERRRQPYKVLMTGTVGTGKSTELRRIAQAAGKHDFVLLLDLHRHFSETVGQEAALEQVSSWEIVFLIGVAAVRLSDEYLGGAPKEMVQALEKAWTHAARAGDVPESSATLDVAKLAKALILGVSAAGEMLLTGSPGMVTAAAAGGLNILGKAADAVKWTVSMGRANKRLVDQQAEAQSMLGAVTVLLNHVRTKSRRVTLILDGLDRIKDHARATELFIDSELIARLPCPMVLSGPFALRHHLSAVAPKRFDKICPLVNEPVLDIGEPSEPGSGIAFFVELYRRRTVDLNAEGLIEPSLLQELAFYSGGRARDFIKLIREVALQADLDDAPAADRKLIDGVIHATRLLQETGVHQGHLKVLEQVVTEHPVYACPEGPEAQELLDYGHLVPYPNDSEWFYPHPLLMIHLVRRTRPAPGSTS